MGSGINLFFGMGGAFASLVKELGSVLFGMSLP